nr:hypothetical protein [Halobacillus shinanisalinarum]
MSDRDIELRNKAQAAVKENEEKVRSDHYRPAFHHNPLLDY